MTTTHRTTAPAVASRRRVRVDAEHPSYAWWVGLTTGLSADKLDPFMSGMHLALWILVAFSLAAAAVSALRGPQPVHATEPGPVPAARSAA